MNTQQNSLMEFDPTSGHPQPYPSHAAQYREYHGKVAWLINPWSGERRYASDVGSDPFGFLIATEGDRKPYECATPQQCRRESRCVNPLNCTTENNA